MPTIKHYREKQRQWLRASAVQMIALVGCLIALSGCASGETALNRVTVSKEFIDEVIKELPKVEACCPNMLTVFDDWYVQNKP